MYRIAIDGRVYAREYTLTGALREVYGCAGAAIVRADGTVAVTRAGSSSAVVHAPSGRVIPRRMTRWARRAWQADMDARMSAWRVA